MNRRDDFHPYLTGKQLVRSPGNFCLICGERLCVRPGGEAERFAMRINGSKWKVIGWVHRVDCQEDDDDDELLC